MTKKLIPCVSEVPLVLVVAALVLTFAVLVTTPIQSAYAQSFAKSFAPGQRSQAEGSEAKLYAPGQQCFPTDPILPPNPVHCSTFAPGQIQRDAPPFTD